jgi:hypothetical protein
MTKPLRTAAIPAGWGIILIGVLILSAIAPAAEPAQKQPVPDPSSCELILGKHIENIVLTDQRARPAIYRRSGSSLFLPPGQYVVTQIDVVGGYSSYCSPRRAADELSLVPGKPRRLDVGTPLTPSVTVKRSGRVLKLDYQLLDADGRQYRDNQRSNPPQFTVYQGDHLVGSGSFEYG